MGAGVVEDDVQPASRMDVASTLPLVDLGGAMSHRFKPRARTLMCALAIGTAAAACDDLGYTAEVVDITGQWSGTMVLDDDPERSVDMLLQQFGTTVMGTVSIEGALTEASLDGTWSTTGRFNWGAHDEDCKIWTGQLVISADRTELSGSAALVPCDGGSVVSGTLGLERN
jgi:hypothetical protein